MTNQLNSQKDDHLPFFDEILEAVLSEEKKSYQNELLTFDQHAAQMKEHLHQGEREYLMRIHKAVELLEKKFKRNRNDQLI